MKKWILSISLIVGILNSGSAMARLDIYPWNIDFGRVPLNDFGGSKYVTIRNYSNQAVRLDVSNSCFSDFRFVNWCSFEIRPNGSCEMNIEFRPYSEGYRTCSIYIRGSDGSSDTVRVSGEGIRRMNMDSEVFVEAETE